MRTVASPWKRLREAKGQKVAEGARRKFVDVMLAIIAMAFVVAAVMMILIPPIRTQVFSVKAIPLKNWLAFLALTSVAGVFLVVVVVN